MKDIYGQLGSNLSINVNLQQFLENRLRQMVDLDGSTLYQLIWKKRVTPLGRQICALRGLGRRNSGKDFGSWPTTMVRDGKGGYQGGRIRDGKISTDTLDVVAQLACWTTPSATDSVRGGTGITKKMTGTSLTQLTKMIEPSGQSVTGSPSGTGKSAQLNPAHSRWLMGYPPEWDDCGVTAMQSSRK